MTDVDEFLKHYGVKGMHWGVRRSSPSGGGSKTPSSPKPTPPHSPDAKAAAKIKAKSRDGGVNALSNKELQTLVTRMNLESQYSRLNPKDVSAGKKFYDQQIKPMLQQELKRQVAGGIPKLAAAITNQIAKK